MINDSLIMVKNTQGSFFTTILIMSAIFLGGVLTYSYILGNTIQPQSGVVEKIYLGIFSSAETFSGDNTDLHYGFDIDSNVNIKQDKKVLFDGSINIKNAQLYANPTGLEQSVGADSIQIETNIQGDKKQYILDELDIITKNQNIYFGAQGLKEFSQLFGFGSGSQDLVNNIYQVNKSGKYAQIDSSQALEKVLGDNIFTHILTSLTTSNPARYFEENNLSNLLKQTLYSDKWIEYIFEKNNKISDNKTHYFILDDKICSNIGPFIDLYGASQSGSTSVKQGTQNCSEYVKDLKPFIALVGQIYKYGDIENGNYDFIISQGSQLDIRFKYSHHILQSWNIFVKNPENTFQASMYGDKFGIKESQIDIDYKNDKSAIAGSIINGTGDISVDIDEQDSQIDGNIILQNYLLIDMDLKGTGKRDQGNMNLLARGDYKSGKVDYTIKNEGGEIINSIDLKYTDKNYKIDYISPSVMFNSLYATGEFIFGYSQKVENIVKKEFKYVYNTGKVIGNYRTDDFESSIQGEILTSDTFIFDLAMKNKKQDFIIKAQGKEISDDIVEYKLDGTMGAQKIFTLNAQKVNKTQATHITGTAEIPDEEINISFDTQIKYNDGNIEYTIPQNIEKIDIQLDQIIPIFNLHYLSEMKKPEFTFAGAGLLTAKLTHAYLTLIGNSREERNVKVLSDIETINTTIDQFIQTQSGALEYKDFIKEVDNENKQVGIRIGGDKLFIGDEYMLGYINYELFGLDKSEIEQDDIIYKIAILDLPETKSYQILGFLDEVGSKQKIITRGNYVPREFVRYDFEIVLPENVADKQTSIQIRIDGEHHLKVGDVTSLGRVLDIVDGIIFVENEVNPDISKVYLLGNDSPTLFIHKNGAFEPGEIITKK